MKILPNGAWDNPTSEGHLFDEGLAKAILEFCDQQGITRLVDMGCGDGSYVNFINENNLFGIVAIGVDGNPHTQELAHTNHPFNFCYVADLSKPLAFEWPPLDLILCLEVGEHIPAEFESVFLDNVTKFAKTWIIMSWATEGQGGDGHVNCRSTAAVIADMVGRGWYVYPEGTQDLRQRAGLPWFRSNIHLYYKGIP